MNSQSESVYLPVEAKSECIFIYYANIFSQIMFW